MFWMVYKILKVMDVFKGLKFIIRAYFFLF